MRQRGKRKRWGLKVIVISVVWMLKKKEKRNMAICTDEEQTPAYKLHH